MQLPVLSAHAPELEDPPMRTFTAREVACTRMGQGGLSMEEVGRSVRNFLYNFADGLFIGGQSVVITFGHIGDPTAVLVEPAYHLDGRVATMEEQLSGTISLGLTVGGGVIARGVGIVAGRLFSAITSRFFSGSTSLFSRSTGTALETTVAAEAPAAMKTGAQLLDELGAGSGGAASQTTTTAATENLAFGLQDDLYDFASALDLKTYRQFTSGGLSLKEIEIAIVNPQNKLHFNLTNFSLRRYSRFDPTQPVGLGNITNWELRTIYNTPGALDRTVFYRLVDGKYELVPNPF